MLDQRASAFADLVRNASTWLGMNAPKIADHIIARTFPRTIKEAEAEGADKMLRTGVIKEIKRVLTGQDDAQIDMAEIDPAFGEIVGKLKKGSYFVEEVDAYVPVAKLIGDPTMLDSARKLLRRKGEECLAEAQVLDELFEAVTTKIAA